MAEVPTVTVPIAADLEPLKRQLAVLRTLCSQIGFALDTALLALDEPDGWADADHQQFDGQPRLDSEGFCEHGVPGGAGCSEEHRYSDGPSDA